MNPRLRQKEPVHVFWSSRPDGWIMATGAGTKRYADRGRAVRVGVREAIARGVNLVVYCRPLKTSATARSQNSAAGLDGKA